MKAAIRKIKKFKTIKVKAVREALVSLDINTYNQQINVEQ